ncbi:MAG: prepilin-type N-terminal cleavage/methylation domain-containing protein [Oscillospiraceae bacterium]|nr:prepilin-type N-terminal cleavage/methylation domain-containing protein [Oscillospiraceae bacterium]
MRRNHKRGFTLIEAAIVLVIVSLLAAIAAPSVFRYIESGRQTNRSSVARTLYLAAQSQLTQMRITKGLNDIHTAPNTPVYFTRTGNGYAPILSALENTNNVYRRLAGPDFSEDFDKEAQEGHFVHFISKPAGQGSWRRDAVDPIMWALLEPTVLDKTILDDAILIEYNIQTGVVLSVFYSDRLENGAAFLYDGLNGDEANIYGGRGMGAGGYEFARDRRQGYFGVNSTGHLAEHDDIFIDVFDSYSNPLDLGDGNISESSLYAEILIPTAETDKTYEVELLNDQDVVLYTINVKFSTINATNISASSGSPHIYKLPAADTAYTRYIWVLDHVRGDMRDEKHTVFRPNYVSINPLHQSNIWARVTDINRGNSATSVSNAHPYYHADKSAYNDTFTVMSARHLYNIRYMLSGTFTVGADIDLDSDVYKVSKFEPIGSFTGTLNGQNNQNSTISNLVVDHPGGNAGLFTVQSGHVNRLTFVNPVITGTGNAGVLCGSLTGTINDVYVKYDNNATPSSLIQGAAATGGIAGVCDGEISNVTFISPHPFTHIRSDNPSQAGGIAGTVSENGVIDNALFLALAPKNGNFINPIAGGNAGAVSDAYYLSGTPIRPDEVALPEGYNLETQNGPGEGKTTWELYETPLLGWIRLDENLDRETVIDPDNNDVYPYRFKPAWDTLNGLAAKGEWPIAEEEELPEKDAVLFYYEMIGSNIYYHDNIGSSTSLHNLPANGPITHDGYGLFIPNVLGERYTLELGSEGYELIIDTVNKTVTADGVLWPSLFGTAVNAEGEEEITLRIYIPNDVSEEAYDSGSITVNLVNEDTGSELLADESFNPLFAPERHGLIRSPRHISNIGYDDDTLNGTYTQQLIMDFALYCYEKDGTPSYNDLSSAVVNGVFNGTYNGGGLEIRNVTINAASADEIGLFAVNGGTIRNVAMTGVYISGREFVGGIAGRNSGTIERSYIGKKSGSSDIHDYNQVLGDRYVGGITGSTTTKIDTCYTDFTRVGRDEWSEYVGGVAGYLDGGTVSNVFYNYGNWNPQVNGFDLTVQGKTANTGGLIGYINAGTLSNAYSDAFFGNVNVTNATVGGMITGGVPNPANVMYLRDTGYNGGTSVGTPYGVNDLRAAGRVTTLGTANWTRRGNAAADTAGYTYPYLSALGMPEWWPMPNIIIPHIAYYEIYLNPHSRFPDQKGTLDGRTVWYGLYNHESSDTLDYSADQVTLEDGYVVLTSANSGTHFAVIRDLNGATLYNDKLGNDGKPLEGNNSILKTVFNIDSGFVLPMATLEGYLKQTQNRYDAICPVQVIYSHSGNGSGDVFKGYINPLFAKSLFTEAEMQSFGADAAAREAYFKNTHQYPIRTPRHLNNIGFLKAGNTPDTSTLAGNYVQEIDVEFAGLNTSSGYYLRSAINSTTKTPINIANNIVPGTFTGTYTAASPYDFNGVKNSSFALNRTYHRSIKNIGVNPGTNGSVTNGGGIFSQIGAGGVVQDVILQNNSISGGTNVGGLTGTNNGTIRGVTSENGKVNGTTNTGGLAGVNNGQITQCQIAKTVVKGVSATGGGAGSNNGVIEQCQTLESIVNGTTRTGGVVGSNNGTLQDSFFLSTKDPNDANDPDRQPVIGTELVGGIVGTTSTVIERVLYLAPAPTVKVGERTYYYPIRGNTDEETLPKDSFYIFGSQYTTEGEKGDSAKWKEDIYNRPVDPTLQPDDPPLVQGGGIRLFTSFFDIPFIHEMLEIDLSGTWKQGDVRYPYPILISMTDTPKSWPETDGPAREDQLNYNEWENEYNRNKVGVVGFINGDFDMPLMNPDSKQLINLLNNNPNNLNNNNNGGWNTSTDSWVGRQNNYDHGYFWIYHLQDWVQGWNTRPVFAGDYNNLWNAIEFQRPIADADQGRMRTDYKGTLNGIYAELNADVQGTLYQTLNTIPETQTYYSFYHGTRFNDRADILTFYLSAMEPDGSSTGGYAYVDGLTPVRPAITPRGDGSNNKARDTVAYGKTEFYDPNRYGNDLGGQRNAYLYDVWLNSLGRGITFWSDTYASVAGGAMTSTKTLEVTGRTAETQGINIMNLPANTQVSITVMMRGHTANNPWSQEIVIGNNASTGNVRLTGSGVVNFWNYAINNNHSPYIFSQTVNTGAEGTLRVYATRFDNNAPSNIPFYVDGIEIRDMSGALLYSMQNEPITSLKNLETGNTSGSGALRKSTSSLTVRATGTDAPGGSDEIIKLTGVTADELTAVFGNDWQTNVVGHWDVASGSQFPVQGLSEWKQYYGLYTIPKDQIITEFAFESNTSDPERGNYLAGVSFKAPGFVTVDKYVKTESGDNAKFVKPGEILTVEIWLKNYGEVTVDNITITDPLNPYDAYIEYVGGADSYDDGEGIVTINVSSLEPGEERKVSFDIKVRQTLYDNPNRARTLQYYFKNQAIVKYFDSTTEYSGCLAPYTDKTDSRAKINASPKDAIQVFIDPVKLTKKITTDSGVIKDGPFEVTITVEDTTAAGESVDAKGMLTILLPPGFTASGFSAVADVTPVAGGYTRIVISGVNLKSSIEKTLTYTYTLEYTGDNFGMAFDSITTNYRYIFFDSEVGGVKTDPIPVLLEAEQTIVGLSVVTQDKSVSFRAGELTPYESGDPGSIIFDLLGDYLSSGLIDQGSYLLKPEALILLDNELVYDTDGKIINASKNANGNYEVRINGHVVELLQDTDGTCMLVITPAPANSSPDSVGRYWYNSDTITLYYYIGLNAEKAGSDPFDLSSGIKKITIDITGGQSKPRPDITTDKECECDDCVCEEECACLAGEECVCGQCAEEEDCLCEDECDCADECECAEDCDCEEQGILSCDCEEECDCAEPEAFNNLLDVAIIAGLPIFYIGRREKLKKNKS